ncbi:unnamed protein product [Periconia digitata]|uniref:Uncharacterized protein n=1 Tax=Periconia digitata TaxID=1303443 RepID=A0A9W4U6A9_9PLEO|nr:unnamed protein product [Periconia digitata]
MMDIQTVSICLELSIMVVDHCVEWHSFWRWMPSPLSLLLCGSVLFSSSPSSSLSSITQGEIQPILCEPYNFFSFDIQCCCEKQYACLTYITRLQFNEKTPLSPMSVSSIYMHKKE